MTEATRKFATGAGWLYGYRWGERLLDLLAIVILARLLVPEDFGLVAIAASVATIVDGLSDFDVARALIRSREDRRSLYDTAWTLSALRGVLSTSLMLLIAVLLPEARIATVLGALALGPLLKGLTNPTFVTFERDLRYARLALLTLGSRIVAVGVTLALAFVYRSYWALVIGILAGAMVATLLSYILRPYRPRICFARSREIFAFSGWMSLSTMVTTLSMETDKIIVGRILGVAEAGLYFMTQRIGVLPTRELISPLQRILFPSFSEIVGDRKRLQRVVRESVSVLGTLGLSAGCGFALVADDLVPLALGLQWEPIVPLLKLLVPFLGLRAALSMTLPCMMALGETRLLFRVSAVYALVHIPAFVTGTAFFGLSGAIGSIVVAGLFYNYLNAWMLNRTLHISTAEILRPLGRPLAAALVMVIAVLGLSMVPLFESIGSSSRWLALFLKIAAGATVFCSVQYVIWILEGRPAGLETRLAQLASR